jgi:hypothetical protein
VLDGVYPILQAEQGINNIPAGGQITGTINLPKGSWDSWFNAFTGQTDVKGTVPDLEVLGGGYGYWERRYRVVTLYLDLDNEIGEPNEDNSTPAIGLIGKYQKGGSWKCK